MGIAEIAILPPLQPGKRLDQISYLLIEVVMFLEHLLELLVVHQSLRVQCLKAAPLQSKLFEHPQSLHSSCKIRFFGDPVYAQVDEHGASFLL